MRDSKTTDFKAKYITNTMNENWNALVSALNCYQFGKH